MAGEPRWKTGLTPRQQQASRRYAWRKAYEFGAKRAWERTNGRCERCGAPAEHTHHKLGRRHKSANLPENLMPICLLCHDWVHKHPAEARAEGYMGSRLT